MLVGCGEERPSLGGVVKPIWLLITTCRLPPVEYPATEVTEEWTL